MKEYYYVKDQDGITIPIVLKHEDGTVTNFDPEAGCIDFSGLKRGDKIRMFNGQTYEGTCEVIENKIINNARAIELSNPIFENSESKWLSSILKKNFESATSDLKVYERDRIDLNMQLDQTENLIKNCKEKIEEIRAIAKINIINLEEK